ncbi:MAG: hypothetical protein JRE56_03740 [Deltaproteobacteria bacterium]|jgi:hypothetical protein|nr:hypothetical protein [Deltaproteobacteria bacterium]
MILPQFSGAKYPLFKKVRLAALCLSLLCTSGAFAENSRNLHFSSFGAGSGPSFSEGVYSLLDGKGTFDQSNALAFDLRQEGQFKQKTLRCRLRLLPGGDGGAFIFLNTTEYGKRGPAPYLKSWVEPNLDGTFAVGIDVHNPLNSDPFGEWGNYQGFPEREVSLHWDGREIVKRLAPAEFRGSFSDCEIAIHYVIGGAEITVRIAGEAIYDRYFLAGMTPYESRLAVGAGTRSDTATEFDIKELVFTKSKPASPVRPPNHFAVFNHVQTNNSTPYHEKDIALPPLEWAYGRVILTLDIHDAGPNWNKWDQTGHLYVIDEDGNEHDIVPFITSYRTPCQWKVDVTHFRPLLSGKVTFKLVAGTSFENNRGYMMSMSLDFYHGTLELEAYRVIPLWTGTAHYKSADNHFKDFFTPQTLTIDASARTARLFITTTGHTKVGEFTPARRTVVFTPDKSEHPEKELQFENVLWRTDCYLNPVRPQAGSWKYARAGWAPGDIVRPWWLDLTPYMMPGKTAELRYEPEAYDFTGIPEEKRPSEEMVNRAVHIIRSYLILYRTPSHLFQPPALKVLDVEEESNAARADIQAGDYIVSYNGIQPDTIEALRVAIKQAKDTGKKGIETVIYRDAKDIVKELEPGRMGVTLIEQ